MPIIVDSMSHSFAVCALQSGFASGRSGSSRALTAERQQREAAVELARITEKEANTAAELERLRKEVSEAAVAHVTAETALAGRVAAAEAAAEERAKAAEARAAEAGDRARAELAEAKAAREKSLAESEQAWKGAAELVEAQVQKLSAETLERDAASEAERKKLRADVEAMAAAAAETSRREAEPSAPGRAGSQPRGVKCRADTAKAF